MKKQSKIALAMICRGDGDEPVNLRRCLENIAPFVDDVFITLTGKKDSLREIEKVCREFNVHISYGNFLLTITKEIETWLTDYLGYSPHAKEGDTIFLFDEARNYSFSQVPKEYDWVMWLDCDDVVQGGENIRHVLEIGDKNNIDAFYLNYLYQVEFDNQTYCEYCKQTVDTKKRHIKNIVIEHLRERIVRNDERFKWIAPIHETLIEQVPTNKTDNYDLTVVHLATIADRVASFTRNLKNLEYAIYFTQGKDPRHVYYLAKAYFDLRTSEYHDRTIPLIQNYLYGEHKSGWPAERAQACEYLAEIYRIKGEFNNSIKYCMNAMIEEPDSANVFLNTAVTYMMKREWERSLFWARFAANVPPRKSTLINNPRDTKGMLLEVLYNCHLNLGHVDEAWAAAQKLYELAPQDEGVKRIYEHANSLREQRDVAKTVYTLSQYLQSSGEIVKIKPLLAATPAIAQNTPVLLDLYQKNNPPKYWGEDEVAIYCGPGFTQWSPKQLEKPGDSFVGGSEEAVILMTKELAKLGWKVMVYGDPGDDEGEHESVMWKSFWRFNKLDHFNTLIVWRQPRFFEQPLTFKKGYVWMHDIANPFDFTPEVVQKITKVFFLSRWHWEHDKRLVERVPESKILFTSNGI